MRKLPLFLLIALFFLSACKKEKFVYESEWLSPLFSTSLGIGDLLPDSLVQVNSDNSLDLIVEVEENIDSLAEILEVPDSLSEVSISLTQLILDDRSFVDTVTLVELYPAAILLNGQTTTLPAQDITSSNGTVIDVTEEFFQTATFNEGYIDVSIYNDLPVEVESIEFELLNESDNSPVVIGTLNSIPAFGFGSKTFDLAGKTVEGKLIATLKRVKTLASAGPVLINAYKGIRLELTVRDLKPESATAIFPAQNLIEQEEETTYNFGGPKITVMRLKKGVVLMEVYSTINEEIILEYEVPESRNMTTGEKIFREFRIPPAINGVPSKINESLEIGEFEITYKGKDVNVPPYFNTFYSVLKARIEYTGEVRTLSLSDSVYIKFGLVDVEPSLAIGDFGKRTYDFTDPINIPVFQDLAGQLSLEDATLDLIFENTFGIEALIEVKKLEGQNTRNSKEVSLLSTEFDNPIFLGRGVNAMPDILPYTQSISLTKLNSNFKLFLENLPNKILPDFTITTRPYGSNNLTDFAFDNSYLKTRLRLHIPINIGMDSLTLIKKQKFNWGENDLEKVKEGTLKLLVNNGFPWSAQTTLEFLDENDVVIRTAFGTYDDLIVEGEIDPATDKVSNAVQSVLELHLSLADITELKTASKVRIIASFNTPNASRYAIYEEYKMDIKLTADFIYEN